MSMLPSTTTEVPWNRPDAESSGLEADRLMLCHYRQWIDICDAEGLPLAVGRCRLHPLRACLTVLLAVPAFFAVPATLFGILVLIGVPDDLPLIIAIPLGVLVCTSAFVGTWLVLWWVRKRRIIFYGDEDDPEPLFELREVRKYGHQSAVLEVRDGSGESLGRIHRDFRNRYHLLDADGRLLATAGTSTPAIAAQTWIAMAMSAILAAMFGRLYVLIFLHRLRRYVLWGYNARTAQCDERLGAMSFDAAQSVTRLLNSAPAGRLDRRILLALAVAVGLYEHDPH